MIKSFICSFGHPSRPIVRPRKYKTTSSDIDKVVSRNEKCDLDQIVDIGNDINEIRNRLNVNKENEAVNIVTQCAAPSTNNNYSDQLINVVENVEPLNVDGHFEQCFIPQKTYTNLLPLRSTSGFNVTMTKNNSTFPHFTSSPHMHKSYVFLAKFSSKYFILWIFNSTK